ncbi:MAG: DUF6062 family protein [Sulfolobales archaeon]
MIFINISDAMRSRDKRCPICYLLDRLEDRYYENLLYENVNDPSVRENIRISHGFCPYHAFKLANFVKRSPGIDGLGSTLIYIDMLKDYIDRLNNSKDASIRLREPGKLWSGCNLCSYIYEFELIYVNVFTNCIKEAIAIYLSSSSILCYKHLYMIINRLSKHSRGKLIDIQIEKLRAILRYAERFVEKHDYRFKGPIYEDEARAWLDAIEILKGSISSQIALISSYRDLEENNKHHISRSLLIKLYRFAKILRSNNVFRSKRSRY